MACVQPATAVGVPWVLGSSVLQSDPCSRRFPPPIQVKCYHKKYRSATRDVIFRLQFHTGAVQGYGLVFGKEDLDNASKGEVPPAGMGGEGDTVELAVCFLHSPPEPSHKLIS